MNRYRNTPLNKEGIPYRSTTMYPDIPAHPDDTYVISTTGDRFDILASAYYNDSTLWWVIATANPSVDRSAINITAGVQIRIPYSKARILELFQTANISR